MSRTIDQNFNQADVNFIKLNCFQNLYKLTQ